MIEYRSIRVGLLGAGSVGSQVARLLLEHSDAVSYTHLRAHET